MLELDKIYFLHPQDRDRRNIRVIGPGGQTVFAASRYESTPINIFIPETEIVKAVKDVTSMPWLGQAYEMKLYGMTIRNLKAVATEDGYIVTKHFPATNSGAFQVGSKKYSLFRDVFIVPHLGREMRSGSDTLTMNSHPCVYFSFKDRDGWEIGRA